MKCVASRFGARFVLKKHEHCLFSKQYHRSQQSFSFIARACFDSCSVQSDFMMRLAEFDPCARPIMSESYLRRIWIDRTQRAPPHAQQHVTTTPPLFFRRTEQRSKPPSHPPHPIQEERAPAPPRARRSRRRGARRIFLHRPLRFFFFSDFSYFFSSSAASPAALPSSSRRRNHHGVERIQGSVGPWSHVARGGGRGAAPGPRRPGVGEPRRPSRGRHGPGRPQAGPVGPQVEGREVGIVPLQGRPRPVGF